MVTPNIGRALRAALILGASTGLASAQTPLSGALSDSTTGPLQSGVVYHVTGNISVNSGSTLTIEPGAIVKFEFDRQFTITGTLLCNGTGPDSVIFTDIRDDSAGGDTNGNGNADSPSANWWRGVSFSTGSDASQLTGLTVRYGGRFISNLELVNCDASFTDCRSEFGAGSAWDLNTSSRPTLLRCSANACAAEAFDQVHIEALPAFSGLTATSNGFDRINVVSAGITAGTSLDLGPDNFIDSVLYLNATVSVPASSSLTIQPDSILKMSFDRSFFVDGTMSCNGTASSPVYITDVRDDSVGGDTNNNGNADAPTSNWWRGIQLRAGSDASVFTHTDVRFGGRFVSAFEMTMTSPTIQDCVIRTFANDGVDLNTTSFPSITNLRVETCSGEALTRAAIQAVPLFSGLDFVSNGFDRLNVSSALISTGESITLTKANLESDVLYLSNNVTIQDGATLRIDPGVIIKCSFDRSFEVNGTLEVAGAPNDPVIITDERDDAAGGDTNGNGSADAPTSSWWRGLSFRPSSTGCFVQFADLRYGGRFISAIEVVNCSVSVERSIISDFSSPGIDLNATVEPCPLLLVEVNNCLGSAITGVRLERLQDIEFARGSGNTRNTVEVSNGALAGDVTIEPENQFNGSIYLNANVTVPAGVEWNLQAGVVLKVRFDAQITVDGALTVRASLDRPVIITDFRDDSVGGDTNGNGNADLPARGWWRGVQFRNGSNSLLQGLEVRYGGRFIPGIFCQSATTVMRDVKSSFSSSSGMRFSAHLIDLEGLVANDNFGDGIEFTGGSFNVRRVTAVNNSAFGIDADTAFTGDIRDSIIRDNGNGPVDGLAQGRVFFSNGVFAGTDGNIDADPLFADPAGGDYRLATDGSPSFNAGDPASPLDPDSTRADQGAYFFNVCEPSVICQQTSTFGPCAQTVSHQGFASLTSPAPCFIRVTDAPTQQFGIFFYGLGAPTTVTINFGDICVAAPYVRTGAVFAGGNFADGNCAGVFEFDVNGFIQTGVDPNVVAGSNLIGHIWYRNPFSPAFASFSDGVQFPVCP